MQFEKLENVNTADLYDKLKEGFLCAGIEKKDGTVSYRVITANGEFLERTISSNITHKDTGKAKKAHWTDGLSDEEKRDEYVSGRRYMFVYDASREGRKGVSINLNNIVEDDKVGDLDNLLYFGIDQTDSEEFKNLHANKMDIGDFIKGNNTKKSKLTTDQKQKVFERLEKGVVFATFRKQNGEVREMLMTRDKDIVDELSGEGSYDSLLSVEEDEDKYIDMLTSGVYEVYDLTVQDSRKFNSNNLLKIDKYPSPLINVKKDSAMKYITDEISLEEAVLGNKRKKKIEDKNLNETLTKVEIIDFMVRNTTNNDVWMSRYTRLGRKLSELNSELEEKGTSSSKVNYSVRQLPDNKGFWITIGDVQLIVSPKGILDVSTMEFEYRTHETTGRDRKLTGVKEQQDRVFSQRNALGMNKSLMINYILNAFNRRKKLVNIKFFDERYIPNN